MRWSGRIEPCLLVTKALFLVYVQFRGSSRYTWLHGAGGLDQASIGSNSNTEHAVIANDTTRPRVGLEVRFCQLDALVWLWCRKMLLLHLVRAFVGLFTVLSLAVKGWASVIGPQPIPI